MLDAEGRQAGLAGQRTVAGMPCFQHWVPVGWPLTPTSTCALPPWALAACRGMRWAAASSRHNIECARWLAQVSPDMVLAAGAVPPLKASSRLVLGWLGSLAWLGRHGVAGQARLFGPLQGSMMLVFARARCGPHPGGQSQEGSSDRPACVPALPAGAHSLLPRRLCDRPGGPGARPGWLPASRHANSPPCTCRRTQPSLAARHLLERHATILLLQVALATAVCAYLSTVAGFLQGTSSCLLATLSLGVTVISRGENGPQFQLEAVGGCSRMCKWAKYARAAGLGKGGAGLYVNARGGYCCASSGAQGHR